MDHGLEEDTEWQRVHSDYMLRRAVVERKLMAALLRLPKLKFPMEEEDMPEKFVLDTIEREYKEIYKGWIKRIMEENNEKARI